MKLKKMRRMIPMEKNKKTEGKGNVAKSVAIVVAIVVALAAIGIVIFAFVQKKLYKPGVETPEEVVKVYFEAFSESSDKKLISLCPGFIEMDEKTGAFDKFKENNINVTNVVVNETRKFSDEELQQLINGYNDLFGEKPAIEEACELHVSYHVKMEMEGQNIDDDMTQQFVVIKYQGRWYLYS